MREPMLHETKTGEYVFSLEHITLGYTTKMHKSWTAVYLYGDHANLGPIGGFRTRLDACQFLIKLYDRQCGLSWDGTQRRADEK